MTLHAHQIALAGRELRAGAALDHWLDAEVAKLVGVGLGHLDARQAEGTAVDLVALLAHLGRRRAAPALDPGGRIVAAVAGRALSVGRAARAHLARAGREPAGLDRPPEPPLVAAARAQGVVARHPAPERLGADAGHLRKILAVGGLGELAARARAVELLAPRRRALEQLLAEDLGGLLAHRRAGGGDFAIDDGRSRISAPAAQTENGGDTKREAA